MINEAREKSEQISDTLFVSLKGMQRKPRTYRQKARRLYAYQVKNRKRTARQRRKTLGQQLRFLRRIPIEGKFGQAKGRVGLNCIMASLSNNSATVIVITFMVMNLAKWLQKLFCILIFDWQQHAEVAQKTLYVFMAELPDLVKGSLSDAILLSRITSRYF